MNCRPRLELGLQHKINKNDILLLSIFGSCEACRCWIKVKCIESVSAACNAHKPCDSSFPKAASLSSLYAVLQGEASLRWHTGDGDNTGYLCQFDPLWEDFRVISYEHLAGRWKMQAPVTAEGCHHWDGISLRACDIDECGGCGRIVLACNFLAKMTQHGLDGWFCILPKCWGNGGTISLCFLFLANKQLIIPWLFLCVSNVHVTLYKSVLLGLH